MSVFFFLAHLLYFLQGVHFLDYPLYEYWQYLPLELLKHKLLESLWYLHSQPPVFNAFLGIVLKLFPEHFQIVFQGIYMVCGFLLYLLTFSLYRRLGVPRVLALVLSTIFLFSPSYILYEQYLFYTLPLAFLLTFSAVILAEWLKTQQERWLWGYFLTLFFLGGIRSLFHLVYYALMALFPIAGCRRRRRRILLIGAFPFLCLSAIYIKNWVVFDKFSVSSWFGMNLCATTTIHVPLHEREQLVRAKRLSPLAVIPRFSSLDDYPNSYISSDQYPNIAALRMIKKQNGTDNLNHFAYIRIADQYFQDALYVVTHYPKALLVGLVKSWTIYFKSSTDYFAIGENREKIRRLNALYDFAVYGKLPIDLSITLFPTLRANPKYQHYLYLFLLLGLPMIMIYAISLIYRKTSPLNQHQKIILLYLWVTILYVAVLGNTFEFGENNRFRFMTDPFYVVLLGVWLHYGVFPWGRNYLSNRKNTRA